MKNSTISIRTVGSLLIAIVMMIAFNSCSGYTNIEKRHYRSGFYVSKSKSSVKAETNEIPVANTFPETEISDEIKPVVMDAVKENPVQDSVVSINAVLQGPNLLKKNKITIPETSRIQNKKMELNKIIQQKNKKAKEETDDKKKKKSRAIALLSVAAAFLLVGFLFVPVNLFFIIVAGIFVAWGLIVLLSKNTKTDDKTNQENEPDETDKTKDQPTKKNKIGQALYVIIVLGTILTILGIVAWGLLTFSG